MIKATQPYVFAFPDGSVAIWRDTTDAGIRRMAARAGASEAYRNLDGRLVRVYPRTGEAVVSEKYPIGIRVRFDYSQVGDGNPDAYRGIGTVDGYGKVFDYIVLDADGQHHYCLEDEVTTEPERTTP